MVNASTHWWNAVRAARGGRYHYSAGVGHALSPWVFRSSQFDIPSRFIIGFSGLVMGASE